MAGDLIPPPSPAGRPAPDAMAEVRATAQLEDAAHEAERPPAGQAPHRGRFGFLWGALAGVALCVLALGAVLALDAGGDGPRLADHWSSWQPDTARMIPGAEDIAAHVAREYKLDSGDQLASIRTSGLEIGGAPLGVAVKPRGGELQVLKGDGLLYLINVLGTGAKTASGKAAKANERLMLREGVELALYSFRYLDDVTMVIVMLPPRTAAADSAADGQQSRTLLFRPGDLLDKLQVPLSRTLAPAPPRPKALSPRDASQIDELALRNLFLASIQPLDSTKDYLVLSPPEVID